MKQMEKIISQFDVNYI